MAAFNTAGYAMLAGAYRNNQMLASGRILSAESNPYVETS
jgi:hypothetical protein